MAQLDLTSFDAALKKYYTDDQVKSLVYKNRPLLAMIPKSTRITGKSFEVPITIGAPGGRSQTFAQAIAAKQPSTHKRFSIPHRRNYALADIDGLTMEASIGDRGAFMEAATTEINLALEQVSNDAAWDLYRDGTGLRGVVLTNVAGLVTLNDAKDIHAFEVNMTLEYVLAGSGVGGAVVGAPTTFLVTAVDRSAGTLTIFPAAGPLVGDFLFQLGDASNSGARPDKIMGLDGWLPDQTTPVPATLFFGVDRSVDPTRLAGVFYDAAGAGDDVEEALINGGEKLFTEGGSPTHVFAHPQRVAELDRILEGRGRYEKTQSADAEVGFEAIVVHTGGGTVMVMADPWCPLNEAFMLQLDTWKLVSLGTVPKILRHDGQRVLRVSTADAVEVRTGYYANTSCKAPGRNARIKLA